MHLIFFGGAVLYVVFEHLKKSALPKVHSVHCNHYMRWLENQSTSTTAWHGPYGSLDEAMEKCVSIAKEKGMFPRTAECCKTFF
jgi:hypothetical protein